MMRFDGGRNAPRATVWATLARAIVIGVVVASAGCATAPQMLGAGATLTADSPPETKQAAVKKRVEARWAAMIKGDAPASYALLSPASKAVLTEEQYKGRIRGSGFTAMQIDSINCVAESCQVRIFITYDTKQMKGIRTPATETWVIDQGEYWYVWPS